jgi:PPIC-type PPIASE domain.
MIKKLNKAILLVLLALPVTLSAQKYNDGLIDKTVALIGNEAIFLSQIENEIKMMQAQGEGTDRNTRCEVLEYLLEQKLYLNQAKIDSLTVNEAFVGMELDNRMGMILTQLGGEKEAEEYFKKPMHKIRQEWAEALREQSLTQQMQSSIISTVNSATPSEVEDFYKKVDKDSLPIISTQYKLSQIVLYPNQEQAKLAVKERLLDFRNRIMKGERFTTLATLYSEDPGSAIRGGELRMASKKCTGQPFQMQQWH